MLGGDLVTGYHRRNTAATPWLSVHNAGLRSACALPERPPSSLARSGIAARAPFAVVFVVSGIDSYRADYAPRSRIKIDKKRQVLDLDLVPRGGGLGRADGARRSRCRAGCRGALTRR